VPHPDFGIPDNPVSERLSSPPPLSREPDQSGAVAVVRLVEFNGALGRRMSRMERIRRFRVRAARCEELAEQARAENMRQLYRDMATQWREMADQVSLIERTVTDLRRLYGRADEPDPGEVAPVLGGMREDLRRTRHRDQEITVSPGTVEGDAGEAAAPKRPNGAEIKDRDKVNLRLIISRP